MTPLIDVIFLLLLFFMLTSTFSKFAEVELAAGGVGQGADPGPLPPLFLQLGEERLALNGDPMSMDRLESSLRARVPDDGAQPVIISLREDVTAQRLTDLLVVLRAVPRVQVTLLGDA